MKLSVYNSQKIKALSFIAIMMVLFIHAVYNESATFPIANYIQEFCAFSGLSFPANPLFFAISGYLFFLGMNRANECIPKIRKRVRTLLVPYLVWNVVFVLWYIVLSIIPGCSRFVNSDITSDVFGKGLFHSLYFLFIEPAGFHLWFLRDLIVYVLFSPIIYICLRKLRGLFPIILFIAGTLALIYLSPEIKIWGAFFFVLGGYIALNYSLDELHELVSPAIAYVCLAIYLLNAAIRPFVEDPFMGADMVVELCGLVAIWRLYDEIGAPFLKPVIAKLGCWSFFIYLFHEPVFNIFKKLGLMLFGMHEWSLTLLYLVNPFIMAAVAILTAILLKKAMPKVYSLCVGGR